MVEFTPVLNGSGGIAEYNPTSAWAGEESWPPMTRTGTASSIRMDFWVGMRLNLWTETLSSSRTSADGPHRGAARDGGPRCRLSPFVHLTGIAFIQSVYVLWTEGGRRQRRHVAVRRCAAAPADGHERRRI